MIASQEPGVEVERRAARRMSIEQDVEYRVLARSEGGVEETQALGKTVNISSSGVLFTTEHLLPPGRRIELAIQWPAQLNQKCGLKLMARGRVVRFEGDRAAIEIMKHEFRTRRS
jgi:c-di-GMP-binding flagellar brake protein YcgR